MQPSRGVWFAPRQGRKRLTQKCWDGDGSGEVTGRGLCRFAVLRSFFPTPSLLPFALVDQHRLRSILPPISSCVMAERMAPDSELRFAFCWRVGRRVHSFRIQRGRRSRGVPAEGGRPCTSSPQRTRRRRRTDSLSVTPPPHSTVYFPLDSPDLSPRPSGRPSVFLSIER